MDANATTEQKALEARLRQKEDELHRHYSQMGKSLLEMAEGEQRVVDRLVDEIIEARASLAQLKGQRECPECTTCNDADSLFCKRCGAALRPRETNPETDKEI